VNEDRLWRRRRRAGGFTFLLGVLGGTAGMAYGMVTAPQPDTPVFDALGAFGIVLLFTGLGMAGIGLLAWLVATLALRRSTARSDQPH
jgi:hypothetical protein